MSLGLLKAPSKVCINFHFQNCVTGKYMQMMNVLKPIAFDVVICMSQLFDYYLFSVSIYLMLFCTGLYAFVSTVTRY